MDYEIKGYVVKWNDGKNRHKKCTTEECALDFAKEKSREGCSVTIIKELCAVGWE